MKILKYRISRRHTLQAGKRWILWQLGRIISIIYIFGYLTLSDWFEKVTYRCSYRTSGSSLVIHGRVTDFQMWNKVLPDSQLKEVPENITWVSSWSSFADHQLPPVQGGEPGQLAGRRLAPQFIPWHRESSFSLLGLGTGQSSTIQNECRPEGKRWTWKQMFVPNLQPVFRSCLT